MVTRDVCCHQLAYQAGGLKPIFAVIPGRHTIIRWREGDHFRDLGIFDDSLSALEIEAEIRRKLKHSLTTIPPR